MSNALSSDQKKCFWPATHSDSGAMPMPSKFEFGNEAGRSRTRPISKWPRVGDAGVMGEGEKIHEHVHFLQKPFSPTALAAKVRQVLEA